MTDPISDMIIRIKNAQRAGKASVEMPHSNAKFELAKILAKGNFIEGVDEKDKKTNKKILISLKYGNGLPAISDIVRKSKPSRRIYLKKTEINSVRQGRGLAIISTPKGLLTDKEARKAGVGGELICEIW